MAIDNKTIFINLPVKDPEVSMNFYIQIGFINNPLFTFEDQKCMIWSDQIYLMLQSYEKSGSGGQKNIADPQKSRIATFTLPVESLDRVNDIMEKGLKAGGRETGELIDEDFMQIRNMEDPDGHNWGIVFLDIEKFKKKTGKV